MTGLRTPGTDLSRQFDVDRYLLDSCRDVVAMEIAAEAVRSDPDVTSRFRCAEQLRSGVEKLLEAAAIRQRNVDLTKGREWTVGADTGLGVKDHDDGRPIVEMGIEVPPFIMAAFRAGALTVFKPCNFNRRDAQSVVI